jgi:hypothetical protein
MDPQRRRRAGGRRITVKRRVERADQVLGYLILRGFGAADPVLEIVLRHQ